MAQTTSRCIVRPLGPDQFAWEFVPRHAGGSRRGTLAELGAECVQLKSVSLLLLLPPELVTLRSVQLEASELRFARKTVPYRLEEQLLQDVEDVHVALGLPHGNEVPVAIITRDLLDATLGAFAASGLMVTQCVPGQCLLMAEDSPRAWSDGRSLIIRVAGADLPRVVDASAFALALEPFRGLCLDCLVEPGSDLGVLHDAASACGVELLNREQALLDIASATAPASMLNMLQGDYAPRINWRQQWQSWRLAVYAVAAAVVLHTGVAWAGLQQLRQADRALRADMETVYRQLYPQGVLENPQEQLRVHLERLRAGTAANSFLQTFYPVGEVLAAQTNLSVNSLRFVGASGQMILDLSLPNNQEFETLRRQLDAAGVSARLQSSTSSGGVVRQRIQIP